MASSTSGVLQIASRKAAYLRDPARSFQPGPDDVFVPPSLIQEFGLVEGAAVTGAVRRDSRGPQLGAVESVGGLTPAAFRSRTPFSQLVAVDPHERFRLSAGGHISMRVVDLIAPIGKGTRGLIVAPPKSGKTILLEQLARAIRADDPATRVIMLLVDERPEEVTHFRRAVDAEVLASSNDQGLDEHINLVELTMAHVRVELECGRNVVVLVDSLTRMARAFNLRTGSGRTLSGGVDVAAMERPRRFLGLARKIERGGSVTILATTLVGTGSRMDDLIFEEFKSTGNSEIVLDRALAEARIFPAINLLASGTRKEEQLYTDDEIQRLATLRRWLAGGTPKAAMRGLLKLLEQAPTNEDLLARLKPAA
jgi:transcription termination factor Rho